MKKEYKKSTYKTLSPTRQGRKKIVKSMKAFDKAHKKSEKKGGW